MKEFVVVGRPNSGKTMFVLNFAHYLGSKNIDITFRAYDGLLTCKHYSIEEAKIELCGLATHKTKLLQSLVVKMQLGKTAVNFKLSDSCGLMSAIHKDEAIRQGMAQTISQLRAADFIFHVIDVSSFMFNSFNEIYSIDRDLYNYGLTRKSYALLANKIDLDSVQKNYSKLAALFSKANIIRMSALHGHGFKEVKACVANNL